MISGLVAVLGRHFIEIVKLRAYAAAFFAAAAASLLFTLVFVLVSIRHWIVVRFGSEYPDLWLAFAFLVLAVAMVALGLYLQRKDPQTRPAIDLALLAGPSAARLAVRRLNPRVVVIGAILIGGLMIGRRLGRGSN